MEKKYYLVVYIQGGLILMYRCIILNIAIVNYSRLI